MATISKLKPLEDQTRRGQIVRKLRDLIIGAEIEPGTRLTEIDLANSLGVSRAPLREAIRELVDTGLLQSVPYKGLFVRTITRRDIEELYSLRTALEQFAFRQAWEKRTEENCNDLRDRNRKLIAAVEAKDSLAAIELELELHSWCYELSGHSLLQSDWERMKQNLQFYFTLHQKAHGRAGPLRESHDIYVACACGDDLQAMLDHLETHMQQGLIKTLDFVEKANQSSD
jgi:DNA-binding GntR family transcriptional regulator